MTRIRPHRRLRILSAALGAPLLLAVVPAGAVAAAAATPCQNWTGAQPPSPGAVSNELLGVAAVSACDAWAVGDDVSGTRRQTFTEHWDGSSWAVVPSPDPGSMDNVLTSVRAISAANVWAAGYSASGAGNETLILYWNGITWKQVTSPDPGTYNRLYGMRAISARDIWAVGFFSKGAGDKTLVLHWDGTRWGQVPSPDPGGTGSDNDLFSVAATARNDIWAVGELFASGKITTLILHWNGTRWARVPSPSPGHSAELFGVAATSNRDAWAVGTSTNGTAYQTLVLRWNGTRWAQIKTPDQGGSANNNILLAISATGKKNAWAVGWSAHGTGRNSLVLHWNGTAWAHVGSPNLGTSTRLFAATATSATSAWAVGDFGTSAPSQALAIHCC